MFLLGHYFSTNNIFSTINIYNLKRKVFNFINKFYNQTKIKFGNILCSALINSLLVIRKCGFKFPDLKKITLMQFFLTFSTNFCFLQLHNYRHFDMLAMRHINYHSLILTNFTTYISSQNCKMQEKIIFTVLKENLMA